MQTPPITTQKFILKLFPEIMIKGPSAKRQMVGQLYANLIQILEKIDNEIIVKKFSDKIEIFTPIAVLSEVRQALLDTSGIEQILEALQFEEMDNIEKIKAKKIMLTVYTDNIENIANITDMLREMTDLEVKEAVIKKESEKITPEKQKEVIFEFQRLTETFTLEFVTDKLNTDINECLNRFS